MTKGRALKEQQALQQASIVRSQDDVVRLNIRNASTPSAPKKRKKPEVVPLNAHEQELEDKAALDDLISWFYESGYMVATTYPLEPKHDPADSVVALNKVHLSMVSGIREQDFVGDPEMAAWVTTFALLKDCPARN